MSKSIFRSVWSAVVVGVGLPGCAHYSRECCAPPAAPCETYNRYAFLPPHPLTPLQAAPVYSSPVPQPVLQPPPMSAPAPAVQPPVQPEMRSYAPPANGWQPSAGGSAATPVPPTPEEPRRESPRLYPPQTGEPPMAQPSQPAAPAAPVAPAAPQTSQAPPTPPAPKLVKPQVTEERPAAPSLPVGIPQFAVAKKGVTSGLKPSLDGLEWLQANNYRAVLHVRQPGEDDSADRQLVEKHKMKYFSIEVSPKTLTRAVVEDFSRIVDDPANHPLFVYDKDGMLAGGLWYLHFRTAEQDSDEVARIKAERLGLKTDASGAHLDMWRAIQAYLGEQNR